MTIAEAILEFATTADTAMYGDGAIFVSSGAITLMWGCVSPQMNDIEKVRLLLRTIENILYVMEHPNGQDDA